MSRNITLKDVAREAGVSYQTVSKVLRGEMRVTPAVKTRILQAVEDLGYRPNISGQHLRMQCSYLIGYSWQPDRQHYFNPVLEQFQQSIVEAAEVLGYHILLFPQREGISLQETYRKLVHSGRVDGFILSGLEYDDPRIPLLQELKVPFVAFGRSNGDADYPYVDVDGTAGMFTAVQHLIEQGHTRIAILAWPKESRVGADRLAGYQQAMQAAGLAIDPAWVVRGESEYAYGFNATTALLNLPAARRPTAIATVMDLIGIGAIRAIEHCGLAVGRDIAVTGFDDMPDIHYLKPSLTTLRQPVWEVGQRTVHLLIDLLRGTPPAEQQILLPPELVIRESSQGWQPA